MKIKGVAKNMIEREFIKEYRERRGLRSLKKSKEKVEAFWENLGDILKEDKGVIFKGWGKFEVKEISERKFSNPKTKKLEKIPAQRKIVFKAGKNLKDYINIQREG